MENIVKIIEKSQNIAILSHIDEDSDAFGSSLALLEMLKNIGKNATYFLSKPIEYRLEFLSDDYVVFDEDKDYGKFDLVICLDSGEKDRLGKRAALFDKAKVTVNIDHHYTNPSYADYNIVCGEMSSTGEIIYDLIVFMNEEITKSMAGNLYCAIMGDTGCLKYSCATPKTLKTVAHLMEKGIDHAELSRRLFDTEKINTIKLKGQIMNSIMTYFDGKVSLVCVKDEEFKKAGVRDNDVGDIVNIPRSVEGTQIAVSLREVESKVKISLRSNGEYNVGEIAVKLNGGGHKMAAGAALYNTSMELAQKRVIEVIGEFINDRI